MPLPGSADVSSWLHSSSESPAVSEVGSSRLGLLQLSSPSFFGCPDGLLGSSLALSSSVYAPGSWVGPSSLLLPWESLEGALDAFFFGLSLLSVLLVGCFSSWLCRLTSASLSWSQSSVLSSLPPAIAWCGGWFHAVLTAFLLSVSSGDGLSPCASCHLAASSVCSSSACASSASFDRRYGPWKPDVGCHSADSISSVLVSLLSFGIFSGAYWLSFCRKHGRWKPLSAVLLSDLDATSIGDTHDNQHIVSTMAYFDAALQGERHVSCSCALWLFGFPTVLSVLPSIAFALQPPSSGLAQQGLLGCSSLLSPAFAAFVSLCFGCLGLLESLGSSLDSMVIFFASLRAPFGPLSLSPLEMVSSLGSHCSCPLPMPRSRIASSFLCIRQPVGGW